MGAGFEFGQSLTSRDEMQAAHFRARRRRLRFAAQARPRTGRYPEPVSAPIQKLDTAQVAREALAEEIARLELLRRLAMGAAHTLNNAFTAILGETLCLADERKHDPLVSEACDLIQGEVERCARLTRSIAARVQRRENALEESNIAALVRGLEPLLRETVSRSVAMSVEVPDLSVLVRGPGEDLELLVLLVAHRLALTPVRGAALHLANCLIGRSLLQRIGWLGLRYSLAVLRLLSRNFGGNRRRLWRHARSR